MELLCTKVVKAVGIQYALFEPTLKIGGTDMTFRFPAPQGKPNDLVVFPLSMIRSIEVPLSAFKDGSVEPGNKYVLKLELEE